MTKAGVIGLTKALAQELAPSGITVNCVCPGIIDTRMNSRFDPRELANEVPMGRLGTPEEVAGMSQSYTGFYIDKMIKKAEKISKKKRGKK